MPDHRLVAGAEPGIPGRDAVMRYRIPLRFQGVADFRQGGCRRLRMGATVKLVVCCTKSPHGDLRAGQPFPSCHPKPLLLGRACGSYRTRSIL
jgi:hypothetical protein